MAHQVETMFYAREVPWHGLGVRVENALTSEEALKTAGLEWEVASRPVYAYLPGDAPAEASIMTGDSDFLKVTDRRANIRLSDQTVLGVVSDRYRIVQNRDAFSFTDALLGGAHKVRYESAGSLFNGRRVWMLAKMDGIDVLGDVVEPYLVFTNSHDASTGVRVAITPIRVVCNNTLTMAIDGAVRVWSAMHTGNIMEKINEAQETLRKVEAYIEGMPALAEVMADTNIYPDEVEKVFDALFPTPKDPGKIALANIERQKNTLNTLWQTSPDIAEWKDTAWGLYNAVTDMAGHMVPLRETETFAENRFATLVDGHPLIAKAQEILVRLRA